MTPARIYRKSSPRARLILEALEILKGLEVPREQQNKRSALTTLALQCTCYPPILLLKLDILKLIKYYRSLFTMAQEVADACRLLPSESSLVYSREDLWCSCRPAHGKAAREWDRALSLRCHRSTWSDLYQAQARQRPGKKEKRSTRPSSHTKQTYCP